MTTLFSSAQVSLNEWVQSFSKDAVRIAGDRQGLHASCGIAAVPRHAGLPWFHLSGTSTRSARPRSAQGLLRRKKKFTGGHGRRGNIEILRPDCSDQARQIIARTASDKQPGAAGGKGVGKPRRAPERARCVSVSAQISGCDRISDRVCSPGRFPARAVFVGPTRGFGLAKVSSFIQTIQ